MKYSKLIQDEMKDPLVMEQYYNYLNVLRDSGKANMFGASSYLQDEFDLSRYEAKDILLSWMKSFSAVASKTENGHD
jgi:hypothetical protein